MKRHTKVISSLSIISVLAVGINIFTSATAYGYSAPSSATAKWSQIYDTTWPSLSGLDIDKQGDKYMVSSSGGSYISNGTPMYGASMDGSTMVEGADTGDGQGAWGIIQFDASNTNVSNGYLVLEDPQNDAAGDIATWINRLHGNKQYVQWYLWSKGYWDRVSDSATSTNNYYDSFSQMVSESGATFGNATHSNTGLTTKVNGKSYPVIATIQHINASNPPSAISLSAVDSSTHSTTITQGDSIQFSAKSSLSISSSIAGAHYDAIEILNSSGQHVMWAAGSGYQDSGTPQFGNASSFTPAYTHMSRQSGGSGTLTDTITGNGSTTLQPGTYTAKFWVADQVDRVSTSPAQTTFTVVAKAGGGNGGGGSGLGNGVTLSANPISLSTGQNTTLTATANGEPAGSHIRIVDSRFESTLSGGLNEYDSTSNSSASITASSNTAMTDSYVAQVISSSGQITDQSQSVSVTWTSGNSGGGNGGGVATPTPTITFTPSSNMMVSSGTSVPLSYSVSNWQFGDYVWIMPSGNGGNTWNTNDDSSQSDSYTETEFPQPGASNTIVTYIAYVMNSNGQIVASTESGTITWTAPPPPVPTITCSPSTPMSITSGQSINLSYQTQNWSGGDYVVVSATGTGTDKWQNNKDTNSADSMSETENPFNGNSATASYTFSLYNSSGQLLSQASTSVTWTSSAPTISMAANPQTLVPGQPSTISYTVSGTLGGGDYVNVVGTGGSNMWSASNQTNTSETYTETENPGPGQTTTVSYTATIYDSTGHVVTSGSVAVKWVNAWNGTVNLSATPVQLAVGNAAQITATASTSIPSGYTLIIKDNSTGQLISQSSSALDQTSYTSYNPETDQFVAYIYDGYITVGPNSNTVPISWSSLVLTASPSKLAINQNTTLTVTGLNVPANDYLVIYDKSTGQVVGTSQSSPYSATQTRTTAETDNFVAYISSDANISNAIVTSTVVPVAWYSLTLTANPLNLPINQTSTLTATTQNLPSGYVLLILDQTLGKVIATGAAGQTTLSVTQTMSAITTHQYIAEVAVPPSSGSMWIGTYSSPAAYQWQNGSWINQGNPGSTTYLEAVGYNSLTNTWYGGSWGSGVYQWNNGTWTSVGGGSDTDALTFDPDNGALYGLFSTNVEEYLNGSWTSLSSSNSINGGSWGGITYDSTNKTIIVADTSYSNLWIMDTTTNTWSQLAGPASSYYSVIYDNANNSVYVCSGSNIWVYNFSNTTLGWQSAGTLPSQVMALGYDPSSNTVYATGAFGVYSYSGSSWQLAYPSPGATVDAIYVAPAQQTQNFSYTGTVQTYTAPYTGTYRLEVWGAQGGLQNYSNSPGVGGNGGYSEGTVDLTAGQTLYVYVGQQGTEGLQQYINGTHQSGTAYNGGGDGAGYGSGGGGGTDIRNQSDGNWQDDLATRLIVAGGGGGATFSTNYGGAGGGLNGQNGFGGAGADGASQTAGGVNIYSSTANGSFGIGGNAPLEYNYDCGGGGGGWYGGAGGYTTGDGGGAGGSGYTGGVTNGQTIEGNATMPAPSGGTETGQTGNGYARITILNESSGGGTSSPTQVQATSLPVSVTWFNYTTPPDNFGLNATPSQVSYPSSTTFQATFDSSDATWVNSQENGSAGVAIFNKSTMQQVAIDTWNPTNGMTVSIPYTPQGGTDLNYVAFLLDSNGNPIASSNQVEVSDQGQGTTGSSYTTMSCGSNGDEIYQTYTNGVLSATKTVPLTISNLEVDGLFNPPPAQLALPNGNVLPLANTANGIPVYCRAQAPFDIAVDFPDVTPTTVTATFTVNNGDPIDTGGDTSWSVSLKPDTSYLNGYWNAPSIMPKLPQGDTISVTITAIDSCGAATLTNMNFMQISGDPEWYFTNQSGTH
ncbi:glycine-rich protein [Alicyclobacillus fodiniaquatilis]|uniref:receptor protein-tyrosine kinase n=1 Tax=Alicyclobacillus fodiniaquatilis TaxID=1661150 RepID=A0ABW4JEZ3_9BACL